MLRWSKDEEKHLKEVFDKLQVGFHVSQEANDIKSAIIDDEAAIDTNDQRRQYVLDTRQTPQFSQNNGAY